MLRRVCFALVAFLVLERWVAAKPISQPLPAGASLGALTALAAPVTDVDTDGLVEGAAVFDTIERPLPADLPSVGFESTGTAEFGDWLRLDGRRPFVDSVTVTMTSQAIRSDYADTSPWGFTHPITLNIYSVNPTGGLGERLASITHPFLIPWRPEPDPVAPVGPARWWRTSDGKFHARLAFNITFDLSELHHLQMPDEVIVGIAFNTQHYGPAPLGRPGPYDHVHLGLNVRSPNPGTDADPDTVFWRTAVAGNYADRGAQGVNIFRADGGWAPYVPAVRLDQSLYGMLHGTAMQLSQLTTADLNTALTLDEAAGMVSSAADRALWDGSRRLRPGWGRLALESLAEAAALLEQIAIVPGPLAATAGAAIDSMRAVAQALADGAVAEAIIGGGNVARILRANEALDLAVVQHSERHIVPHLQALVHAWSEADEALR